MIVRSLDGNDDWTFGRGKNNYLKDNQAVQQTVATRLRSFLGDCFFDTTAGIDWFHLLGTKNIMATELAVKTVILNTPSVTSIEEFSAILNSQRKLSLTYSATTVFSKLQQKNQVIP